MTEEKRGGPSSRGGPGGGKHDGRPQGGRDGKRGGPRKGGGFVKGPIKPARAETYESLRELARGQGFRIDKFVLAEKGTHKLVKTEYRLTRDGLNGIQTFQRLVEAQAAATAPLPEPEPEPAEQLPVEEAMEIAQAADAVAEREPAQGIPAEGEAPAGHAASEETAG